MSCIYCGGDNCGASAGGPSMCENRDDGTRTNESKPRKKSERKDKPKKHRDA